MNRGPAHRALPEIQSHRIEGGWSPRRSGTLARIGLTAVLMTAVLPEASAFALRRSVVGNGGSPASGASMAFVGTVGQSAVGRSAGPANELCHGFWCSGGLGPVSVDDPRSPDLPATLSFGPPCPNPSSGAVSMAVALPGAARVEAWIHDLQGRQVRRLDREWDAGYHALRWDGVDGDGRRAAPGVYFVRLVVDCAPVGRRRLVVMGR